ncbi:uncharacterized protein LOC129618622 [Condylostylus longicornis]|uniref:uncharacterized protein LOC129618622 n=1 Tax=Condylostylus longicornis TaxID=2530218 RepID=UPI00244E5099|nr:uncharacterized protein LOC129618622 [Condylostylus longicornis]
MNDNKDFYQIRNENLGKDFYIILMLLLFISRLPCLNTKYCSSEALYKFGNKLVCESNDGFSTSCLNNPKRAHIQCERDYYNDKNISSQTIYCKKNGQWSDQPMECRRKCVNDNGSQLPSSYVDVVEKTNEANTFSGLVMNERDILIKCEHIEGKTGSYFKIRKQFKQVEEYVHNCLYEIPRVKFQNEEWCVLVLNNMNFIRFDRYTKPNCLASKIQSNNPILNNRIRPEYKSKCYPPEFDIQNAHKVEILCYNFIYEHLYTVAAVGGGLLGGSGHVLKSVDCQNDADRIIVRCNIGYQNTKSKTNSFLNKCSRNKWAYKTENIEVV